MISIVESNSVIREHVTVEEKRVISSDTEYSIVKKLLFFLLKILFSKKS